jgi:hypothetical protein
MASHGRARRQREKREEGAVMMVVLLILLTATALAGVSLQSTQFELRSAGYNRIAMQAEYVSEAAASTTIAWVDATSMDSSFLTHLAAWAAVDPPKMVLFGEPEVLKTNRMSANRTQWKQQKDLTAVVMPPLTETGSTIGTSDVVGSLGPRNPYLPGIQDMAPASGSTVIDYVVDLYDCKQLPNTGTAGSQVNQSGSGSLHQIQYYCVVTSRGRAYVPGAPSKKWSVVSAGDYIVNRFTMAHDSRGTIITPPMFVGQ